MRTKSCLAFLTMLIAGIVVCGSSAPGEAEPFIRVRKNGVIYYYFSDRGSHNYSRLPIKPRQPGVLRSQARNRISRQELEPMIQEVSRYHNLPPALVKAVIRVESNFNPAATSPKGAQGLMQLMPKTAESLQVANPYDVRENIWAGTRYLVMLLQRFNNSLPLALAAYNAGPERVQQCQRVPSIEETRAFVRDVCANFLQFNRPGE